MLWAGLDPSDFINLRIEELKDRVNSVQYKKAILFQRAISEAVCGGSLGFVDAYKNSGSYEGEWIELVDFPKLPSHNSIVIHMTRITQAAFMRWAMSKNIPSYKLSLQRTERARAAIVAPVIEVLEVVVDVSPVGSKELLLLGPSVHDATHAKYSPRLSAALKAWEATPEIPIGRTPKQAVIDYLTKDAINLGLAHGDGSPMTKMIEKIAETVNWNQKGGPPRTPGGKPTPL